MTDKKSIPGVYIYISDDCKFTKKEQTEIIELIGLNIDKIRRRIAEDDKSVVRFNLRGFEWIYNSDVTLYENTVMIIVRAKIDRI